MTNTTGNTTAQPGWYDDPSGTGQKRWWDGAQWTEHLHDPSLEVYGAVAIPVVGVGTPVYNVFIWLITLLPLLSLSGFAMFDMAEYMHRSMAGEIAIFTPSYLLLVAVGWGPYLVTALLAFFDWRRLQRDGFVRPFHWAWSFLSGSVYIIGRSVVVKRRSGRGLLPIWIWVAVLVISLVVSITKVVESMSTVFATLPSFS